LGQPLTVAVTVSPFSEKNLVEQIVLTRALCESETVRKQCLRRLDPWWRAFTLSNVFVRKVAFYAILRNNPASLMRVYLVVMEFWAVKDRVQTWWPALTMSPNFSTFGSPEYQKNAMVLLQIYSIPAIRLVSLGLFVVYLWCA
jgi:hypothetical protein